jgi:hypothetical protein
MWTPPVKESFLFLPHPLSRPDPPHIHSSPPASRETRSLRSPPPPTGSSAPSLPFSSGAGAGRPSKRRTAGPNGGRGCGMGHRRPHGGCGMGHSGGTGRQRSPWPQLRVGAPPSFMARPRNGAHVSFMGADAASYRGSQHRQLHPRHLQVRFPPSLSNEWRRKPPWRHGRAGRWHLAGWEGGKGAPTNESREGKYEAASSIGGRIRGGLEAFFRLQTLKSEIRGGMRPQLELPLVPVSTDWASYSPLSMVKLCLVDSMAPELARLLTTRKVWVLHFLMRISNSSSELVVPCGTVGCRHRWPWSLIRGGLKQQ